MYVCICKAVTRDQAAALAKGRIPSAEELTKKFGLDCDDACGRCVRSMERFMVRNADAAPVSSL